VATAFAIEGARVCDMTHAALAREDSLEVFRGGERVLGAAVAREAWEREPAPGAARGLNTFQRGPFAQKILTLAA
jgi:hypothetical protein